MDIHFFVIGTAHFLKQPLQVRTLADSSFLYYHTVYPSAGPNHSVQPNTFLAWQSEYFTVYSIHCTIKVNGAVFVETLSLRPCHNYDNKKKIVSPMLDKEDLLF